MQKRRLGRTGLEVSVLGYGAGAVGGLFTKGAAQDQERAVARARRSVGHRPGWDSARYSMIASESFSPRCGAKALTA